MIAFIHKAMTAESMLSTLDMLEKKLGLELFVTIFSLLLTNRGPKFAKPKLFEFSKETGEARLNIFYCDPLQSSQKAKI